MTDKPLLVATCSWTGFQRRMGIPVRISRSAPRWITLPNTRYTDFRHWPYIVELTPGKAYFNERDDAIWEEKYLAQLNENAVVIRQKITWVNDAGGTAVLCCFEKKLATPQTCHRTMAARWLKTRFGCDVPELGHGR